MFLLLQSASSDKKVVIESRAVDFFFDERVSGLRINKRESENILLRVANKSIIIDGTEGRAPRTGRSARPFLKFLDTSIRISCT